MDTNTSTEQLRELLRLQAQSQSEQREAFSKLIDLQAQVVANQERTIATQRRLFRVIGVLAVIYVVLSLLPIWLK